MGKVLGVVPNLESGPMQKIMAVLQSAMGVGLGTTQIYSGVQSAKMVGVYDTTAFVQFELGKLQQRLTGTEYTGSLAQLMLQRSVTWSKNSMNTIWGILNDIQSATVLNQAV